MLGEERHRPYDRPPLSKAVLLGDADSSFVDSDLEGMGVEHRAGVSAKGLAEGVVETTEGEMAYDGLVIATGAEPIRLPGEGRQHVLRTLDDALALRAELVHGARVVIIGAGWIGAEVATAAMRAGCAVTVLEAGPAPLAHVVGAEVGAHTIPWYDGIDLRLNTMGRLRGPRRGEPGRRREPGGRRGGDRHRRAAHGRVAGRLRHRPAQRRRHRRAPARLPAERRRRRRLRGLVVAPLPHQAARGALGTPALNAPEVAVASLLGDESVYDPVPYFWSEQFGHMVQYAGHHPGARLVRRGPTPSGRGSREQVVGLLAARRRQAGRRADRQQASRPRPGP
ncbi:hypothetical protein GCM10020219_025200 [Nonomuraea dietziae]